ncbi:MAG: hypothetical protein IJO32_00250 [Bacilli bacterium]|nr:hypothetical protein [Bacilli bacterium]
MIKKSILENKIKLIVILTLIVGGISILFLNTQSNSKVEIKKFKNKEYVFTTNQKNNDIKCPYINIDSDEIDKINNDIIYKYYSVIQNKYSKMDYEYSINNNHLSLIIKIINMKSEDDYEKKEYISYNVNISSKKEITNDELLKAHNLSQSEINNNIYEKLKNAYEIESNEMYIEPQECDFNCYLKIHEVDDLETKLVYFIDKENKVIGYLNHVLETVYFDKNDYKEFTSQFLLN